MRIALMLAFIVSTLASVVASSRAQEYAPFLQEDTIAVLRANVDQYDKERVAEQIEQVVKASAVYWGIESEAWKDEVPKLASGLVTNFGSKYADPLKRLGVKTVYCVVNASKADLDSFYNYLAIPISGITDDGIAAVKDALDLTSFEYDGFLIAPIIPICQTEEDVKAFREKHFAERNAISKPALELGFSKVGANDAIISGVGLPLDVDFLKDDEIVETAQKLLDVTQRQFNEVDVETPFNKLLDSLLACRKESAENLEYRAWSVNLDRAQLLVALEFNKPESAERFQRLVEVETLSNAKELLGVLLKNLTERDRYDDDPEATEAFVKILNKTKDEVLDAFVKFERDESALIWKLDGEFFFKNRNVLQGIVGKIIEAGKRASAPTQKINNLKHMALACHNYHDVNGFLPAAYTEDGKTWREAETLKPYLGKNAEVPGYAMLVADDGIFPSSPGKHTNMAQILDGLTNTIMLVELADPKDTRGVITVDEFYEQLQQSPKSRKSYLVAFGDGSVRSVPTSISLEELKAWTTRNGGEDVYNRDQRQQAQPVDQQSKGTIRLGYVLRKLHFLAQACHMYAARNDGYLPAAYPKEGTTWLAAESLKPFIEEYVKVDGCATIIAADGVFPSSVDAKTRLDAVTDGLDNTIMLVELADPSDKRGVIAVEEFYEQLQNCPAERKGYYVAMGSGRVTLLDKATTLDQLKKLVSKAGDDFGRIDEEKTESKATPRSDRDETSMKLRALAIASLNYFDVNQELPAAYDEDGKNWWETGTLGKYLVGNFPNVHVYGCAALVDESGIFVPTPGQRTKSLQIADGTSNTIMFVELADPKATPGCITLEEFYDQLQNCPADRDGYKAVMADGGVVDLPKSISFEDLKAGVSKAGGDMMKSALR